jgi:hypothetical protein
MATCKRGFTIYAPYTLMSCDNTLDIITLTAGSNLFGPVNVRLF